MPAQFQLGPLFLTTLGWNPQIINGRNIEAYVVEHAVPGKIGGIVEFMGARQPTFEIRGFITPREIITDNAAQIVSGRLYVGIQADEAIRHLRAIGGSGAILLRIESNYTSFSGYQSWYENDIYQVRSISVGYEPAKAYPYYPYTINLVRIDPATYGNSSGGSDWTAGGSGYIRSWQLRSGGSASPRGETINTLGVYFSSATSGNAKLAIYNASNSLQAQSPSQAIYSGWNYFPIRPGIETSSGVEYKLAIKTDLPTGAGGSLMRYWPGDSTTSGREQFESGVAYADAFPATYSPSTSVSGQAFNIIMVSHV